MRRETIFIVLLTALLMVPSMSWAKKAKTGEEDGNVFTDAIYGFTFEKNDTWKFKIDKEDPKKPRKYRFQLQKAVYQVPPDRQFSRNTWTAAYGGFFIDTTSLDLEQFKTLLIQENRKHKQKKSITKFAEIIRNGLFGGEKRITLGNLGPGLQLTFKEEYDVEIKDARGNYNIVTDFLMGDAYFTVTGGKVYLFFFTAERPDYRPFKLEIERMLESVAFPGKGNKEPSEADLPDSTSVGKSLKTKEAPAATDSTAKEGEKK